MSRTLSHISAHLSFIHHVALQFFSLVPFSLDKSDLFCLSVCLRRRGPKPGCVEASKYSYT